ncbi:hypothetical protein NTGBS_770014 [Candidatus Nitrotoga sp. BS]|nr:hypothetical protein NTGBS_770014 [Candidatus Nitrotoga sp. BS]
MLVVTWGWGEIKALQLSRHFAPGVKKKSAIRCPDNQSKEMYLDQLIAHKVEFLARIRHLICEQ